VELRGPDKSITITLVLTDAKCEIPEQI